MSDDQTAFRGEDESAGEATPALDLVAAGILLLIGLSFSVLSLMLPVPGKTLTAPGLLPFLTSASLAVMAILLGLSAWRRLPFNSAFFDETDQSGGRRLAAMATVAIYIAALQSLPLEGFVTVGGIQVPIGVFEPMTVLFLCALLRLFWSNRLGPVLAVAVCWTLCLSLAFRGLFGIPLPG